MLHETTDTHLLTKRLTYYTNLKKKIKHIIIVKPISFIL